MAYEHAGRGALDYAPCRYGKSKLLFRGPRRNLEAAFCAAMGGTETYGKFVAEPWPALLEGAIGWPVVNFGCLNAGIDVFLHEPQLAEVWRRAQVSVVQLMGAQNMSNRFYAVHPRRNDRFLRASTLMRSIFPEVDFTAFNFTRHMLLTLQGQAPDRYATLVEELQAAWVSRMSTLLDRIEGRKVLLWVGDYAPPGSAGNPGSGPALVTPQMVAQIQPMADRLVQVAPSAGARTSGTRGMHFAVLEEPAAAEMPGPLVHREIAEQLTPVLRGML